MDFSEIARQYDSGAVVQASAGQRLLALLDIKEADDVLDIGCGTGSLTAKIKNSTSGRVMGIDAEPEMIRQAREKYHSKGILF
ncbi:MAG: methyltransferase domain-containing protein, partial [Nitrospirae bacterium]|nr:methyltransferase domain-containing protein [Nitrospirota bacterium]